MAVIEATPPVLLHKNVPVSGIKVLDDEKGIVEAFVAGIGNKDSTGDIIQPGAFDDSLNVRTPKGVWSHDWSRWVSKTLEARQVLPGDPRLPLKMSSRGVGGLYIKMQFNLETEDGRDAFSNVKFFDEEAEWSIGYMEVESEYSKDLQANLLHKIDLYEYSPVLFGANNLTSTVSVKVDRVGEVCRIQIEGLGNKDLEAQVTKAIEDALAGEKKEEAAATTVIINNNSSEEKAEGEPEEKIVPGSMEARYQSLCDALSDEYPNGYTWPVATFTDSVVYEVMSFGNEEETGTFQRSYSMDEAGEVTFGEPKAVDVVEVVVEKMGGVEALEAKGGTLEGLKEAVAEGHKALIESFLEKAGRVLSVKNQDRLSQAKALIDEVLASGEKPAESEGDGEEKSEPEVEVKTDEPETEEKAEPATLDSIMATMQEMIKLLTATPEVKAEEKATGDDEDDAGAKAHEFVKGDDGNCAVCGKPEDAAVHDMKAVEEEDADEKMTGEDPDDAGAGGPKKPKKSGEEAVDDAAFLASLTEELGLADAVLTSE